MKASFRIALALLLVAGLGLGIQFSVRDRMLLTAGFSYLLSPSLCAALLVIASLLLIAARARLLAVFVGVAAIAASVFAARAQSAGVSCTAGRGDLRVVAWNIWGGRDREAVADVLANFDADVIGLVEARTDAVREDSYWRVRFPGYDVNMLGGGLAILSRERIQAVTVQDVGSNGRLAVAYVRWKGRPLEIYLADVPSNPLVSRRDFIRHDSVMRQLAPQSGRVLLGDFNTPRASIWFDAYTETYSHVLDAAGRGWRPTWPSWFPFVDLDHIWVAGALQSTCAFVAWSGVSDHRPVVADLAFRL